MIEIMKYIIFNRIFFCALMVITIGMANGQNPFQLNGETIWESDGKLYRVSPTDTLQLDLRFVTLEYENNADGGTIETIETNNNLARYFTSESGRISYEIDVNITGYKILVNNLVSNQNINLVDFEYYMKCFDFIPPNDEFYSTMALDHITIEPAWENYSTGNPEIVVGILDMGTNWNHPELKKGDDDYGNIYKNPNDTWDDEYDPVNGGNGNDDDHKGDLIGYGYDLWDDYKGWDFHQDDNNVLPTTGVGENHGTAMSGLVAAKTNNGMTGYDGRISGVAGGWWPNDPGVKVLPVRIGNDEEFAPVHAAVGIRYAVFMGARILNFSWGYGANMTDPDIEWEIEYAYNHGVLMFAAAGNGDQGNGYNYISWPASDLNVIAVVGLETEPGNTNDYCKATISNWGPEAELAGLGRTCSINAYSNDIWNFEGTTSPASATATGSAALMLSYNPCLSNKEVRSILKHTARDEYDPLTQSCGYNWTNGHCDELGYGVINLEAAFMEIDENYPPMTEGGLISSTQPVIWNEKKWVLIDITIESGGVLTITDTVVMNKGKKIVVEPGGKLIIDGGIITTTCQEFWGGDRGAGAVCPAPIPILKSRLCANKKWGDNRKSGNRYSC